jgi:ribosomal protein S18 acetylase RimI-like enzyme
MMLEIRSCTIADLPAVKTLLDQLTEVAHGDQDISLDRLHRLLAEMGSVPDIYINRVACLDQEVVGFLSAIFYKTLFHEGGTCLINELIIDKDRRGGGIGEQLVKDIVGEARRRGMDEVEVGTEQDNQRAASFYQKCGFDETYLLLGMEF